MSKVKDEYDNGLCPDCQEDIPENAQHEENCVNCGHVWNVPGPCDDAPATFNGLPYTELAESVLNDAGDEQGWNDESKIHLLCQFIASLDLESDLKQFLKLAQDNENANGV